MVPVPQQSVINTYSISFGTGFSFGTKQIKIAQIKLIRINYNKINYKLKMSQMQINLICINGMSLANNFQIYLYLTFFCFEKRNTFFECFTLIQCTLYVIVRFKLSFNSKLVFAAKKQIQYK